MTSFCLVIGLVATIYLVTGNNLADFESNLKHLHLPYYFNNSGRQFEISNYYLNFICVQNIASKNFSELCAKQMEIVCNNKEIMTLMADAWSKVPYAGMITATRQDWGAFDQCIGVEYEPEEGPKILGKQCTMGLALPTNISLEVFYLLSYCMPNACSAKDVIKLLHLDFLPDEISAKLVNDYSCATKESNRTVDGSSIAVATLFGIFLGLVLLSTVYEVYLHRRQRKKRRHLLTTFSLLNNGQKLVQTTPNNAIGDRIQVFHGIKVISMMWIVAGHAAAAFSILPVTNREEMAEFEKKRYAQYIATAHLAVDTFFFISGFLLAYQYFKSAAKKPVIVQVMSVPKMIIHRYLRITPVVLMFFLYSVYLAKHIGSGPIFTNVNEQMNKPCKEYWWTVFLYIQNYVNRDNICWVHLWYLSADWQLFLLAPFILIPMAWQFRRRFSVVMVAMLILNIFFMLIPLFTKLTFPNYDPQHLEYETHSKLVTYFVGVMFGFYFRCQRHRPYIFRKGLNVFMWIFSLLILFVATVVFHEVNINQDSHLTKSLSDVFIKPFWCLGLTFIVYSCTHGYGGIINSLLTSGIMQVLSKLTFCMYIMHVPVIFFWVSTRRTRDHFSDFNLFFYWCGHFLISLIVSTIWTLMFESPLINIEQFLMGGGRVRQAKDGIPKEKITVVQKPSPENGSA